MTRKATTPSIELLPRQMRNGLTLYVLQITPHESYFFEEADEAVKLCQLGEKVFRVDMNPTHVDDITPGQSSD